MELASIAADALNVARQPVCCAALLRPTSTGHGLQALLSSATDAISISIPLSLQSTGTAVTRSEPIRADQLQRQPRMDLEQVLFVQKELDVSSAAAQAAGRGLDAATWRRRRAASHLPALPSSPCPPAGVQDPAARRCGWLPQRGVEGERPHLHRPLPRGGTGGLAGSAAGGPTHVSLCSEGSVS